MTAPPNETRECPACGGTNGAQAATCWICGAALGKPAPVPSRVRRPESYVGRWRQPERGGAQGVAWGAAALALGGLLVTSQGLAIPLVLAAVPILIASGPRTTLVGCMVAAAAAVGITFASLLAMFATCSVMARSGTGRSEFAEFPIALLVGVAVFIVLTVVAARAVWRARRRKEGALQARDDLETFS